MQKREHWPSLLKVTNVCECFPIPVYECIAYPRNIALKRGDKVTQHEPCLFLNHCSAIQPMYCSDAAENLHSIGTTAK